MTVNNEEYTVIKLLGKGEGGYSYLMSIATLGASIAQLLSIAFGWSHLPDKDKTELVSAHDADDMLLGEGTFLYDVTQEKLYVTISEDSVTCSTSDASDAPADVPPELTLPILDEIDQNVIIGISGSSLLAIQAAAKLLDWGENTGLGADEINDAASTWLAAKNNDLTDCLKKLELVDESYRKLLTDEARELLDSAGCEDVEVTWGSDPVEPVEAIMQAAGLRG